MPISVVQNAAAATERHPNHLLGKEQIFRWAAAQGWQPQLEPYLKEIAQRPDVLVKIGGRAVALEFQCSPLSAQRLKERNAGYHKLGIAVFWLLGPTYRRRLRSGMISQFTQLRDGHPQLAFWNLKQQRVDFCAAYYQPVLGRRMRSTNDLLLKQTYQLQRHMRYRERHWRTLINRAYLAGHQLSACPLVAHPTFPEWPLLEEGELRWRLQILLKLTICPLGMSWSTQEWQRWLIRQGQWLPTPCLSAASRQRLISETVSQFTTELVKGGILQVNGSLVRFCQQPRWFDNDAVKVNQLLGQQVGMNL